MITDETSEKWAKIPDINYEASTHGRIRHSIKLTIKPTYDNGRGYRSFVSYTAGIKINYVHRCVLMAHNPVDGMDQLHVNHKDFNRANNNIENLEWTTAKDNLNYSRKHGHYLTANKEHSAWMKRNTQMKALGFKGKKVVALRDSEMLTFDRQIECARHFNVSATTVCDSLKNNKALNGYSLRRI